MSIGGAVLTVADLVADPPLRLSVVAGHGGLDREIEAAAVSELAEPGPWLQGGELLLTIGLLLDESDAGCAAYVAGLCAAGVRASAWGSARTCATSRPRRAWSGRPRTPACRC